MAQGTLDDPMTLTEALTSSRIEPGHIIHLLSGTYTLVETIAPSLTGTAESPIIIVPESAQPSIDTRDKTIDWTAGEGEYCRINNIRFHSALGEKRVSDLGGAPPPDITRTWLGVQGGTGGQLYNAIIHDVANVGWSKAQRGGLLADSHIFNIGFQVLGGQTGGGHCMYAQNYAASPSKTISNCIMNGTLGFMLALKGSPAAEVYNFVIENCIFIGGTQRFGQDGAPTGNITIRDCVFWNTHLHFSGHSAETGTNITLENCYMVVDNHSIFRIADSTFQNNTIVQLVSFTALVICDPREGNTWNNNAYSWTDTVPTHKPFSVDDTLYDFPDWQTLTGFDENSTFTTDSPSGTQQFVFACDALSFPRIAHIAVVNWDELETVDVDVSALDMITSGNYRLHNAYDPLDDYDDFVYDGSGSVTVSFVGRSVAIPDGMIEPILTLDARFGAWILEKI
jgi:hypothetical protein